MAEKKPAYGSTDGPYIENPNSEVATEGPVVTTGMNPQPVQVPPPDAEQRLDEVTPGGKYRVDGKTVNALGQEVK